MGSRDEARGQGCVRDSSGFGENALAGAWLLDWAWVFLKTPALQRYASAAVASGFTNGLVQKLANLGTSGLHPGNLHRELSLMACKADVPSNLTYDVKGCGGLYQKQLV